MTEPTDGPAGKATLSAMLQALARDERRDRIAVGDLLAALGDRALAAPLLRPWSSWQRNWPSAALVQRIGPWLARAERLLRPRAMGLALPPMEYLVGLVCLLLALVLVLPVPLGNMLPALAISLLALGILERDGLWILAGLATAAVSAVVVSGVVFATVQAAVYFVTEVLR